MPTLYFLIGLPASGKSTWVEKYESTHGYTRVLSTDQYIETEASHYGKTYSEVFESTIKAAENFLNKSLQAGLERNANMIWDQTNLSAKSRAKKLDKIPSSYHIIAVYFPTPDPEEHARRLNSRPGKVIPTDVIENMKKTIEFPSFSEGFDEIWVENNV